jgi:NAD dependent epimerase/dehydratase family enzyme
VPAPAFALRGLFGQMADDVLLASTRAMPEELQQNGYTFQQPDLEGALRHLLGRSQNS